MKKICLFLFFACFSSVAFSQELRLVSIEDVLSEMQKKDDTTRVLNLWATWCAPCVKELPYFEEVHQSLKDNEKTKIILLAVEDTEKKVLAHIAKNQMQATVWLLNEKDANYWIPKINETWGGEIPVTIVRNTLFSKELFHSGELSKEELLEMIRKSSE